MSEWHWVSINPVWAVCVCVCARPTPSVPWDWSWLTVPKLSPDIDSGTYTLTIDPSITFKNTLGETLSSTPNLTISASHWKRYFSDLSLFVTPGIGFVFRKYFPIELSIRMHFVLLRLQWFRWQHRAFRPQHRCCFSVCSAEWFQDMRDEPASNCLLHVTTNSESNSDLLYADCLLDCVGI